MYKRICSDRNQTYYNTSLIRTVIDASTKEPVSGVTVQLEAVTHQVKTDRDGNFQFVTGQRLPFTIILSYIGYQPQKIVVTHSPTVIELPPSQNELEQVLVTSRRRTERMQDIPLPISIVRSGIVEDVGRFNVNRIKEIISTVQLYSL
ncbi:MULTISPECIES: carboxypeptidase-like regulatory domain-containing protein [Sphingobacterium]|uniref:carboxypeptidase-like regulatory domain-containing protein n=1 Tax=Sphingobacterium TaxID=28453 RepID=UPI001969CFCD|nr:MULTISPECIES: carboxypeptidase-like regulatory domain-containing protein [unclassified Sphingobacterium]